MGEEKQDSRPRPVGPVASTMDHLVAKMRASADVLEADERTTYFPGPEDGDMPMLAIRIAARVVIDGGSVPIRNLGALVRYIADMLEE